MSLISSPLAASVVSSREIMWQRIAALTAIFAAALWSAWSVIDRYFIGDDFGYVARFHALPFAEWPRLFVADWSGGIWSLTLPELRPFAALSFMIDARVWGANPLGYHLTNLALDTLCAWLVAGIVWRVQPARWWAGAVAGIVFAIHPVHAETVGWITGRVDVLATAAYLAGFWAAMAWLENGGRRWLVLGCAAYSVGVFSKEFCLTLPVMVGLYAAFFPGRLGPGAFRRMAVMAGAFVVIFGLYAVCRYAAFPGHVGNGASINPLTLEYLKRQIGYIAWMVPPLKSFLLSHQDDLGRTASWSLAVVSMLGVAGVVVAAIFWRRGGKARLAWSAVLFFGVTWYAVATLPLVVVGYFSPRHLYFATAGFSICVAIVLAEALTARWLRGGVLLAWVLCSALGFAEAIRPWRAAAKVSERLVLATAAEPVPAEDVVWIIDAPGMFLEGWCWAWASPMALGEPFQMRREAAVIERPEAYVAPHLWKERLLKAGLPEMRGAVLFSVTSDRTVVREEIGPATLGAAVTTLLNDVQHQPEVDAWRTFVQTLRRSSTP